MKSVTVADGYAIILDRHDEIRVEEADTGLDMTLLSVSGLPYRFVRALFDEHYEDADEG